MSMFLNDCHPKPGAARLTGVPKHEKTKQHFMKRLHVPQELGSSVSYISGSTVLSEFIPNVRYGQRLAGTSSVSPLRATH